jgi:hypothetical protein
LYEDLKASTESTTAELKSQLKAANDNIVNFKKRSTVSKHLSDIGVDPLMLDIAVDNILPKAAIDDKDSITIEGKAVDEYVKGWKDTDLGKRFTVSGNSGGGAGGGAGSGGDAGIAKFFDPKSKEYNLTEQAKIAKTDIAMYNRLKTTYGQ